MLMLYALIGILLLCASALLAIPFIAQKNLFSLSFLGLFMFLVLGSLSFYLVSGDKIALAQWFAGGKQHYLLMEQFEKLGGIDGAIARIEDKLKDDPKDAQGWAILGKLYLSKNEEKKAKAAFEKARLYENKS